MSDYKYLYSKYKSKYITLRNSMKGGAPTNVIFENSYGGTYGQYTMTGPQARKLYNFLYSQATKNANIGNINELKTNFISANINNVSDISDTKNHIIETGILMLLDVIDVLNGKPRKPWTDALYFDAKSKNQLPTILI